MDGRQSAERRAWAHSGAPLQQRRERAVSALRESRVRAALACLVAMVALTGVLRPAVGAEAAPETGGAAESAGATKAVAYDLTVIVVVPEIGPAQVAIGYPKVVDHAVIGKGLGELAQRTGAVVSSVEIREGQQGRGMSETGTAVAFAAAGLIREGQGVLPVGPIIRSLPEWEHMRLVFLVGGAFSWTGPGTATADGYAVRVVSSMKPIEYDVERKSSRLTPPPVTPRQHPVSAAVLPAVLIGLPAGLLIGWLVYGSGGKLPNGTIRR